MNKLTAEVELLVNGLSIEQLEASQEWLILAIYKGLIWSIDDTSR
jgi:hypothetical protein